jgi:hypothetical protein
MIGSRGGAVSVPDHLQHLAGGSGNVRTGPIDRRDPGIL